MAKKPKLRPWPADTIKRVPLDKIHEYENNPRLHSEQQIEQIAASMQRFGVTTPVLVDQKGELIYGHGRYRAGGAQERRGYSLRCPHGVRGHHACAASSR